MKAKFIVYLCVALLPYNIYAGDSSSDEHSSVEGIEQLDEMAEEGIKINGIFQPIKNGCLGEGLIGFAYKCLMLRPTRREVAIKFVPYEQKGDAMEEFEIYTYLGSLHVPNIESYGIPKVYFFGRWDDYMITALTLLEPEFNKRAKAGLSSGQLNEVDILIAFGEYVRITKYIHSRNIVHNDVHMENLMFRRDRAFIIDYNMAHQMFRKGTSGVVLPLDAHTERRELVRKDWQIFLFSMCEVVGVQLAWFNDRAFDHLPEDVTENYIEQLKRDVPAIMRQINGIRSNQLRRIFIEFAGFVLEDKIQSKNKQDKELFYDYFDRIIREEIEKLNPPKPVLVSWLSSDQRNAAIQQLQHESQTKSAISTSSIKNPFALAKIEYPPVNYLHFFKKRPSTDTPGSSSSKKK